MQVFVKLVLCDDCGNEEPMRLYSREEARRENKTLRKLYCLKCGSTNVRVVN
jgi:Zn finger protein HypA/HybF involved in hydrogenase expression